MRNINERIARRANREDECKGRFWESRFKSQALLDETALIKCMTYVDLNPIRASMAKTPETSMPTSIKSRIEGNAGHLMSLVAKTNTGKATIPIRYKDYLSLVDWTGRALQLHKRGIISHGEPPILQRLQLDSDRWVKEMRYYGRWYYRAVGSLQALNSYCEYLGQQWLKGVGMSLETSS